MSKTRVNGLYEYERKKITEEDRFEHYEKTIDLVLEISWLELSSLQNMSKEEDFERWRELHNEARDKFRELYCNIAVDLSLKEGKRLKIKKGELK